MAISAASEQFSQAQNRNSSWGFRLVRSKIPASTKMQRGTF